MNNDKRLILNIIWVVIGALLLGACIAGVLESELYSGLGGGLIGVGFVQILRNIRYKTDADYKEKMDIEVGDERMKFIRKTSWAWTGWLSVIIAGIGSIIALVTGQYILQQYLAFSVCVILLVFLAVYFVLKKKY